MILWLFHIKDRSHLESLSCKLDCGHHFMSRKTELSHLSKFKESLKLAIYTLKKCFFSNVEIWGFIYGYMCTYI